ncbi:MerR family DNA-binding protein [Saccharothrix sp.]|uniref:MerR family DNA-binding protein n=1 Tax=Saccharothrix sp. TaxID=1873460 RepID=UPI0028111F51|nr:MerR family DNA-binding protein [Saccharothrix sp.]
MPTDTLTIGQLAASTGVTRKAIRVWVEKGLLAACDHTSSGYQLFAPGTAELAVFIRRARALGLSLTQIQDVIQARHDGANAPCTDVRRLLQARIADIDTTIADLLALRATLQTACTAQPDVADEAAVCPIIERTAPPEHPVDKSPVLVDG